MPAKKIYVYTSIIMNKHKVSIFPISCFLLIYSLKFIYCLIIWISKLIKIYTPRV